MANTSKPSAYGGSFGNWLREWAVDRPFLHNRGYDPSTNAWSRRGVIQGLAQTGAGMIAPGADTVAGLLINSYNQNNGPHNQFASYYREGGNTRQSPGGNNMTKNPAGPYGGFINSGNQAPGVGFTPTWGLNPGLTQQFPMQVQQQPTQQAPQLPFNLTATQSGPIRNTITPTGSTPYSALAGLAASNGGARGARSWADQGLTGEAAQSFLEGMRYGPNSDYIYTGLGGPILQ